MNSLLSSNSSDVAGSISSGSLEQGQAEFRLPRYVNEFQTIISTVALAYITGSAFFNRKDQRFFYDRFLDSVIPTVMFGAITVISLVNAILNPYKHPSPMDNFRYMFAPSIICVAFLALSVKRVFAAITNNCLPNPSSTLPSALMEQNIELQQSSTPVEAADPSSLGDTQNTTTSIVE